MKTIETLSKDIEPLVRFAVSNLCQEYNVKLKHGVDVKVIDDPLTLSYKIHLCIDYEHTYKLKLTALTLYHYKDIGIDNILNDQLRNIILELREEQLILELAEIK